MNCDSRDLLLEKINQLDRILDPHRGQTSVGRTYNKVECWINSTTLEAKARFFATQARRLCLEYAREEWPGELAEEWIEEAESFEGNEFWLWYHTGRFPWTIDTESLLRDFALYVIHAERDWNV